MRMRDQSPMLTMSATAPMVQKCVRCATPPNTTASANASHSTCVANEWTWASCISADESFLPDPDGHRAHRRPGRTEVARGQHQRARGPDLVARHGRQVQVLQVVDAELRDQ